MVRIEAPVMMPQALKRKRLLVLMREGITQEQAKAVTEGEEVSVRFTRYQTADPGFRVVWNKYPTRTIGMAVVTGRWCWSLTWRKP